MALHWRRLSGEVARLRKSIAVIRRAEHIVPLLLPVADAPAQLALQAARAADVELLITPLENHLQIGSRLHHIPMHLGTPATHIYSNVRNIQVIRYTPPGYMHRIMVT